MIPQIHLELTLEETNLVLEALGALPYARVYELIAGIQQQAQKQFDAAADARPGPLDAENGARRSGPVVNGKTEGADGRPARVGARS